MLIVTRRAGERIMIGTDITIEVMDVAGNTARIGIDAPRSLPVYREELWAAVKKENEAAAGADPDRLPDPPRADAAARS